MKDDEGSVQGDIRTGEHYKGLTTLIYAWGDRVTKSRVGYTQPCDCGNSVEMSWNG